MYNEEKNENFSEDYESLLRKEERNIRKHIAIENQLKIHCKNLNDKFEEYEKDNLILIEKYVRKFFILFQENIKKKAEEKYIKEINHLNNIIKNFEIQVFKLTQSENKLKNELEKKEKKIRNLEYELKTYQPNNFFSVNYYSRNNINNIQYNKINNNIKINDYKISNSLNDKKLDKYHSDNSSLSISKSISKKDKKNKSLNPLSERNIIQDKKKEYKKGINKKINKITKNKNFKSNINKSIHYKSLSNFIPKDKSIEYDMSLRYKNIEDFSQNINDVSIRIIKGDINKYKTPNKSVNSNKSLISKKNIYFKKNSSKKLSSRLMKKKNIPSIENKIDFYTNNINGYTVNYNSSSSSSIQNNNNNKARNISLRQFIFSKLSTK